MPKSMMVSGGGQMLFMLSSLLVAQQSKATMVCDRGKMLRGLPTRCVPPSVTPLDKRPRTLLVNGFSADEKDEIIMHLRVR